jgi:hypothetical protein
MVSRRKKWAVVEGAAGALGAAVAGKALDAGWRRARGKAPPATPGTRGVSWRKALAWAAVAGLAVAVGRMAATGVASAAWKRLTGSKPPRA